MPLIEINPRDNPLDRLITLVLGLFAIILISASGHLLIRAYELGRTDPQPSSE